MKTKLICFLLTYITNKLSEAGFLFKKQNLSPMMFRKKSFIDLGKKIVLVALPILIEKAGKGVREWAEKDSKMI